MFATSNTSEFGLVIGKQYKIIEETNTHIVIEHENNKIDCFFRKFFNAV